MAEPTVADPSGPDLTAPITPETPPANSPPSPTSIWGDLKVQWPEGIEEGLKEEKTLQSYVDKEGKFNYANALKSLVHTKKAFGGNKISIPGKNATEADWDEFHKVAGWSSDINEYKVEKGTDSQIDEDFLKSFKDAAHKARISPSAAQKMLGFIEGASKSEVDSEMNAKQTYVTEGIANMKKDWGEAYNRKISYAQKAFQEVVPEGERAKFKENGWDKDPSMIRIWADVGERLYREGRIPKGPGGGGNEPLTPEEIDREVNEVRGDPKHPFNNPNHPNFAQAQKDMLKLYERKNKVLLGNDY